MLCRFLLFFIFLCVSIFGFAQSVKLSGVVADRFRSPLPGAVVRISSVKDTLDFYGVTTDLSGQFRLEVNPGKQRISVSMLGFLTQQISLNLLSEETIILDTIILHEQVHQLDEAVIRNSRPAVQFEAGKTIVVPELSVIAGQSDVFTVLKNTPGLIATEEGGISVNGQSGVSIRLNGKDAYLSGAALINFLKSLPAGSVESIEIMSSPSAAYDAAGKAGIINIKLKKNLSDGFMLSARSNFQQSRHNRSDWGLQTTMSKGRASFGFDYSGGESEGQKHGILNRTINMNSLGHTANQGISLINRDLMHGLRIFSGFEISKRLSVEGYASRNFYQRKIPGQSTTTFASTSSTSDSLLKANSFSQYRQITYMAGLQTSYKSEKKRELTFAADYMSFGHEELLEMKSHKIYPKNEITLTDTLGGNFGDQINALSSQADWLLPINSRTKFQTGAKWAHIDINNHAIYTDILNGEAQLPSAQSVKYRYKEGTSAVYAQISGSFKKWNYQAGARLENTRIQGNILYLASQPDSSYKLNYTRLFPSLHAQYALSGERQIAMSYSHRITRPNYRDLSPSGYIVDRYVMANGNPALRPELTRNTEITYISGHSWRTSLYYITNSQAIVQVFRPRQNGGLLIKPENLSARKTFGIKIDGSDILPLKWWKLSGSIALSGMINHWTEDNQQLNSRRIVPIYHVSNTFVFVNGWAAELSGYYNGRMPLGQIEVPSIWSVSGGVRKKMAEGRLTIRLYGTDLLQSIRERSVFRSQYIHGSANLRYEETTVGLSVNYVFTRGHQKELNEKGNEEKKRINF